MPAEFGPRLALALALLAGHAAGDVTEAAAPAPKPAPATPVLDAALAEFLGEFSDSDGAFVDPFAFDLADAQAPPAKDTKKEERAPPPPATAGATPPQEKDHVH